MTKNFTEEDVIALAKEKYGKPICCDFLEDAMQEKTLEDAAEVLIVDTYYWDT